MATVMVVILRTSNHSFIISITILLNTFCAVASRIGKTCRVHLFSWALSNMSISSDSLDRPCPSPAHWVFLAATCQATCQQCWKLPRPPHPSCLTSSITAWRKGAKINATKGHEKLEINGIDSGRLITTSKASLSEAEEVYSWMKQNQ